MFDTGALTNVIRNQPTPAAVIAHCHPFAAKAADQQSLQQRGAFAWRILATVFAIGLAVVAETALVLFVLFPIDVAGVRTTNQHFPSFSGNILDHPVALQSLTRMRSPINEGARVSRIVEDAQNTAIFHSSPHKIALLWPRMDACD